MDKTDLPELRWHDLAKEPPPLGRPIVLFPEISDVGHMFHTCRWTVSNPEYARLHGLERGYTSWFPILPHVDEAMIEAKIERLRQQEADPQHQWHEGFKRAAENIVETLQQVAADRPELINCIRDRFCK